MTDMAGACNSLVFARMSMVEDSLVILASVSILEDFSWKVQLQDHNIPSQCLAFEHANVTGVKELLDFLQFALAVKMRNSNPW